MTSDKGIVIQLLDRILLAYSILGELFEVIKAEATPETERLKRSVAKLMGLVSVVLMNRLVAKDADLEKRLDEFQQEAKRRREALEPNEEVRLALECGNQLRQALSLLPKLDLERERNEYQSALVQCLARLYWTILQPVLSRDSSNASVKRVDPAEFITQNVNADELLW